MFKEIWRSSWILAAVVIFVLIEIVAVYLRIDPIGGYAVFPSSTEVTLQQDKLKDALDRAKVNQKVILFWHKPKVLERTEEYKMKWECGSCQYTSNLSRIDDEETKAVIFLYKYVEPGAMPKTRRTDQLYVWMTKESPASLKRLYSLVYEDYLKFNCTMTNRRDSDIYLPYAEKFEGVESLEPNSELLKKKNALVVAVISNCRSEMTKWRLDYLKKLRDTGLEVKTYGKCFGKKFAKHDAELYANITGNYKFYFAFENSYHCRDYITEKFFVNSLGSNAVPIAWGATRADYEAVAPPNSFIHQEDFKSVKDLADYLKYLDGNDTAYLEYFRWKTMDLSHLPYYKYKTGACKLCRMINGINIDDAINPNFNPDSPPLPPFSDHIIPRTVKSLSTWFYKKENDQCYWSSPKPEALGVYEGLPQVIIDSMPSDIIEKIIEARKHV